MDPAPISTIPRRQAAFAFIFVTVMLDMLAFGIIIPVLPNLIKQLIGGSFAQASVWTSAFGTLYMLMQFISSPIQGTLSDRFGRRVVILLSSFGLGVDFIVMAITPSLWLLFFGRGVAGLCSGSFSAANAYIADIVPKEKRAAAFGMMGAAFAVGFILGPAIGGLLGHWGLRIPFWAAASLSLVNFCYGFFVLPESLPVERRSKHFEWRHANPFGSLVLLRRYPQVFGLALMFFLISLAQYSLNFTYVLYTEYRYNWDSQAVGFTLSFVGLCTGLVQAVMVRRLMPIWGERKMILIGLSLCVVGYVIFAFSSSPWLFLAGIPFLCLGGLSSPPAQALMTQQVDPGEQGRLQGALTSLASFAGIFGPALFANIFAYFISDHAPVHLPGAAFLLASLLLVVATIIAAYSITHLTTPRSASDPAPPGVELGPLAGAVGIESTPHDQSEQDP